MKKNKIFAGKLASWFMVVMIVGTLVGCGKDVPSTPDTTPDTPVVEADVDTNVDVDTDTNVDVDANVDVETDVDVEPVVEPAQVIYEGLAPGGTGYWTMADHDTFHTIGLFNYFVPIDKNEHSAFIAYVGDVIKDGGDYYAARWSSFDEVDIQLYTCSIENCKYAVYFEAPNDFAPTLSRTNDKAIGGCDIRATNDSINNTYSIIIKAYPMDYANSSLDEYELYNTPKDIYIERGYADVKDLLFKKEDGRFVSIVSYLSKNADYRIIYGDFISLDESKIVNEYEVQLKVPLDFSEEDALAIINSIRFMEKDEADELYISLLHQTEANEYFDPATIE
ncbi:MAG: hypothetical protein K6E32_11440 [Lachnospiraceae bacterium]|nr:hypothetical protein [Lachnospiraceae bacterium]